MRLLKVRMLDGAIKSIMVDDSQIVSNMMVIICTKIGITNHDEYSLVREKTEDEENQTPNKKYGTLGTIGGTLTLKRKHKNNDPDEPQIDPKMATLRKNFHTEDGGKISNDTPFKLKIPQLSDFPFVFPGREMALESRKQIFPPRIDSHVILRPGSEAVGDRRRLTWFVPVPVLYSDSSNIFLSQLTGWTMARHYENKALMKQKFYFSEENIFTAMPMLMLGKKKIRFTKNIP